MKRFSIIAIVILVLAAGSAFAAKKVMLIENGSQSGSAFMTQTADGLQLCSQTTTSQCLILNPKSLPTGTTNLLAPMSISAAASSISSTISGQTAAAVASGPTLTITQPGTYMLFSNVTTSYYDATFDAAQGVTCELYRINNTPGAIAASLSTAMTPTITTGAIIGPSVNLPTTNYTTSNSDDALQVYCLITADPSAGAIRATSINMLGVRIQ